MGSSVNHQFFFEGLNSLSSINSFKWRAPGGSSRVKKTSDFSDNKRSIRSGLTTSNTSVFLGVFLGVSVFPDVSTFEFLSTFWRCGLLCPRSSMILQFNRLVPTLILVVMPYKFNAFVIWLEICDDLLFDEIADLLLLFWFEAELCCGKFSNFPPQKGLFSKASPKSLHQFWRPLSTYLDSLDFKVSTISRRRLCLEINSA